ncbi:DUF7504 family protein [Natronomonas sp. EA1]|uniref:DUF7504 family protein n=1 Tax=Natronomonas sp. EA1 TaxID=3421655 RepID=UPI003EBC38E7
MYEVTGLHEELSGFEPGTSALVTGPDANERVYDAMAEANPEEGAILITTDDDARTALEELTDRGMATDRLGIVDASGSDRGDTEIDGVPVRGLSSPADLTGISLEFSKLLSQFDDSGVDQVRVGFTSLSTLLMYAELRTVFRFLHVFSSRIRSASLLAMFAVTPDMHEAKTMSTIRTVFDCEIRLGDGVYGTGYE